MEVTNSLNGMLAAQMQINVAAQNIAQAANITGDTEFQEQSIDLIDSLTSLEPQTIAYKANAKGIITQEQVYDTLLDIKA